MKFTGLSALHRFFFGNNNDGDPTLPPLPGLPDIDFEQPTVSRSWYGQMREVIKRNNTFPGSYEWKPKPDPNSSIMNWIKNGIQGEGTFDTEIPDGEDYIELNNNQAGPSNAIGVAGPSQVIPTTEQSNKPIMSRRSSFDDIPPQPTPFAETSPIGVEENKGKGVSRGITSHFRGTSVDSTNFEEKRNQFFKNDESDDDETDGESTVKKV